MFQFYFSLQSQFKEWQKLVSVFVVFMAASTFGMQKSWSQIVLPTSHTGKPEHWNSIQSKKVGHKLSSPFPTPSWKTRKFKFSPPARVKRETRTNILDSVVFASNQKKHCSQIVLPTPHPFLRKSEHWKSRVERQACIWQFKQIFCRWLLWHIDHLSKLLGLGKLMKLRLTEGGICKCWC